VFDHQNPTNIDEDMTFPATIIWTQFHHGIFVGCKDCNNPTTAHTIHTTGLAMKHSGYGDAN
jgi:hypothetical protein